MFGGSIVCVGEINVVEDMEVEIVEETEIEKEEKEAVVNAAMQILQSSLAQSNGASVQGPPSRGSLPCVWERAQKLLAETETGTSPVSCWRGSGRMGGSKTLLKAKKILNEGGDSDA